MTEHQYSVIYTPAEEGGYVVTCPALPGVVTEGDSLEEARTMAQEAVRAYLESLQKDGLPISADKPSLKEEIRVLLEAS